MRTFKNLINITLVLAITTFYTFSFAATITVDSTTQESPLEDNGNCTLAEAIEAANTNLAVDACTAGSDIEADVIELQDDETYTFTEIYESKSALPIISDALQIKCNNSTLTRDDSEGIDEFRLLYNTSSLLILEDCTLANGLISGANFGGAIANSGTLTVSGVTIRDCEASLGGAIHNSSSARVVNSFIYNNIGNLSGGSIYTSGTFSAKSTTIAGNSSDLKLGGAIFGNEASTINLVNATITDNNADEGGGIYTTGELNITNTIIAGNTATTTGNDCIGAVNESNGYNILEDFVGCTATEDDATAVDPLLSALSGSTDFGLGRYILQSGSPAIDGGEASYCTANVPTDQIGQDRVSTCDLGAIEAYCSDGVVQTDISEECDDGNLDDGDGCDSSCLEETEDSPSEEDSETEDDSEEDESESEESDTEDDSTTTTAPPASGGCSLILQ